MKDPNLSQNAQAVMEYAIIGDRENVSRAVNEIARSGMPSLHAAVCGWASVIRTCMIDDDVVESLPDGSVWAFEISDQDETIIDPDALDHPIVDVMRVVTAHANGDHGTIADILVKHSEDGPEALSRFLSTLIEMMAIRVREMLLEETGDVTQDPEVRNAIASAMVTSTGLNKDATLEHFATLLSKGDQAVQYALCCWAAPCVMVVSEVGDIWGVQVIPQGEGELDADEVMVHIRAANEIVKNIAADEAAAVEAIMSEYLGGDGPPLFDLMYAMVELSIAAVAFLGQIGKEA
jgi:hypothetical protein